MFSEPPSLLITDDDSAFRETLQGVFQPLGLRTLLASDGEEALRIVGREPVHVIVLDMHMPKLTGLETLRLVKHMRALLPCILLSADWDELLIEQARRASAFSILAKPVTRHQITGAVQEALAAVYNWRRPR